MIIFSFDKSKNWINTVIDKNGLSGQFYFISLSMLIGFDASPVFQILIKVSLCESRIIILSIPEPVIL
jgi:hypothetical protein